MNRLTKLLVICCTVTVLSGCNRITNKAASTPEEFARSVVELLAANDSEELLAFLFPSTEEIRDFAPEVVPEDRLEQFLEELDEEVVEQRQEIVDSLKRFRSGAASVGLNLEKASFVKCKHDGDSLKSDIFVTISVSGEEYEFLLDDCSLINGRWYNMDGLKGLGKTE